MYASNEHEFTREEREWVFLTSNATVVSESIKGLYSDEDDDGNNGLSTTSNSLSVSSSSRSSSTSSSPVECEAAFVCKTTQTQYELEHTEENLSLSSIQSTVQDAPVIDTTMLVTLLDPSDFTSTNVTLETNVDQIESVVQNNESTVLDTDSNSKSIPTVEAVQVSNDDEMKLKNLNEPHAIMEDSIIQEQPVVKVWDKLTVLILLLLSILLLLGPINGKYTSLIELMEQQSTKIDQSLKRVQGFSVDEFEQRLIKKFEERTERTIDEKLIIYNERQSAISWQLLTANEKLYKTQGVLEKSLEELRQTNDHLQAQIRNLEQRLEQAERKHSKRKEESPKGATCKKSSTSPLDVLITKTFKQTVSIAKETSSNITNLFDQWTSSVNDFLDQRHQIIEEGKRKLSDFAQSSTVNKVQSTIRQGVAGLSASFEKAKSNYETWSRARAEERARARKATDNQEKSTSRHPWRWTFQRGHNREQMRHHPSMTSKQWVNPQSACYSLYNFPMYSCSALKH